MNTQTNVSFPESINSKEINIKEHILLIKKRLWIIILITIISTSIGMIKNTFFTTPLYQSSTRMIIGADDKLMPTLQVLMRDNSLLQKVVNDLGINRSPEGLAQQISVSRVDGSQVVNINVIDTNPSMAAEIANATARIFASEAPNIVGSFHVKLLTAAKINPYPINSDQIKNIVISFMIGAVLGVGMIYFIDSLDDSIRSKEEIENIIGFPVIGTVSKMNKKNMNKINNSKNSMEVRGESIGY